ncbi:unnamed protein product [Prorocentrum cordatum]|uniref:Uncharacterized protein n=1 Tax=Prorocentrum cordatum TaxID=2364126 RepID=A0ABN9VHG2_9DINO|nr:unnamed protein product [Polarella glacialis]
MRSGRRSAPQREWARAPVYNARTTFRKPVGTRWRSSARSRKGLGEGGGGEGGGGRTPRHGKAGPVSSRARSARRESPRAAPPRAGGAGRGPPQQKPSPRAVGAARGRARMPWRTGWLERPDVWVEQGRKRKQPETTAGLERERERER